MSLDCVITVPAGGGNGAPKSPMTDKVSRFIKDSDYYYRAVFKHVKDCPYCDPEEAIRGYLENRYRRMFGRTSGGLVKLAMRYRKAFPDRVSEEIVSLFVERSMSSDWGNYLEIVSAKADPDARVRDVMRALDFEESAWREEMKSSIPRLQKMAKKMASEGEAPRPGGYPQPFYFLCCRLLQQKASAGGGEPIPDFHEIAVAGVLRHASVDYSEDADPGVRKAVKLLRMMRGDPEGGTIMPTPPSAGIGGRGGPPLAGSGYEVDPDPDVSSLAQAMIVMSVMRS